MTRILFYNTAYFFLSPFLTRKWKMILLTRKARLLIMKSETILVNMNNSQFNLKDEIKKNKSEGKPIFDLEVLYIKMQSIRKIANDCIQLQKTYLDIQESIIKYY